MQARMNNEHIRIAWQPSRDPPEFEALPRIGDVASDIDFASARAQRKSPHHLHGAVIRPRYQGLSGELFAENRHLPNVRLAGEAFGEEARVGRRPTRSRMIDGRHDRYVEH